jgi:hypothetical protein
MRELHCQEANTLLIPCNLLLKERKTGSKFQTDKDLNGKFALFTVPFPANRAKSSDYGQNLSKSQLETKKYAAKFAAAGNLEKAEKLLFPSDHEVGDPEQSAFDFAFGKMGNGAAGLFCMFVGRSNRVFD